MREYVDVKNYTRTDEAIDASQVPIPPKIQEALVNLTKSEGELLARRVETQIHDNLTAAAADSESAIREADRHREDVDACARERAAILDGHVVPALISGAGFAVTGVAEWVLNANVLPYVMSVSRYSLAGVALCVAPTLATVALEQALNHVFQTDKVWDAPDPAEKGLRKVARAAWRGVPFAAVGVLSIACAIYVTRLRPIVAEMRRGKGQSDLLHAHAAIDQAMLWLALALVVIGAVFYIFAAAHLRRAWRRWRLGRRLRRLRRTQAELDRHVTTAAADLDRCRRDNNEAGIVAELVRQTFVDERLVKIAQLHDLLGTPEAQVSRILRDAARW